MRDSKGRFVKGNKEGFQKGHPPYNNKLDEWRINGGVPWNKGIRGEQSHSFGVTFSEERRRKISEKAKGNQKTRGKTWKQNLSDDQRMRLLLKVKKQHKRGTDIEIRLQNLLREKGVEFKSQVPLLKRYLVDLFVEPNIVIEADGEYWHDRIESTIRDGIRDAILTRNGYKVIRFWGKEIQKDINDCWIRLQQFVPQSQHVK